MTWVQVGVAVASIVVAFAGVAVAAWFGFWTMADRRFAEWRGESRELRGAIDKTRTELRGAIDRANENNDRAHGELRAEIQTGQRETNARLDALAADVHVLVGRQQERDRAPADD